MNSTVQAKKNTVLMPGPEGDTSRFHRLIRMPFLISAGVFLVSLSWIYFSDRLAVQIAGNNLQLLEFLQFYKGIFFISSMSAGLFGVLYFTFFSIQRSQDTLKTNLDQTLLFMVKLIESRDSYTAGHSERVSRYCDIISQALNLDNDYRQLIVKAALVHDIGKIETPDTILLKPEQLSNYERNIIKKHSNTGFQILKAIEQYEELASVMRYHHERWDGLGYPDGLKAEEIPLGARVMAVADAFDAMTSNRVYRSKLTVQDALYQIKKNAGFQFDPDLAGPASEALLQYYKINSLHTSSGKSELFLEAERMSYYFRDRTTGFYCADMLHYLRNNPEIIEEFRIFVIEDGISGKACKVSEILKTTEIAENYLIILINNPEICVLLLKGDLTGKNLITDYGIHTKEIDPPELFRYI